MNAGRVIIALQAEDDVVISAGVQPGALHRGAEMLFEVRDYRQALSLANRHDWQAPMVGELVLSQLVESQLGVEVPSRAHALRCALVEHHRIQSHLANLSFVGHHLGLPDLDTGPWREQLRLSSHELTGNRVHPMVIRLGGVAVDADQQWCASERRLAASCRDIGRRISDAAADAGLGVGIAPVSADVVAAHGLTGPIARASGASGADLRTVGPHAWPVPLPPVDAPAGGDAAARLLWLAAEIEQSAALIETLLTELPAGPLQVRLPQVVKLPEGDAQHAVEAPLGHAGMFVVSRGEKTPWRLALRTPSFANASALETVLPGCRITDLPVALASLPWVPGDLDK